MEWRLGLDVGSNSLGWAVVRLDEDGWPTDLGDTGVRIFSDGRNPKDLQSKAATRRGPRGARRNRDRYLKRRAEFMARLIEHGLMPEDEAGQKAFEKIDPWALRVKGLDEKLELHEIGRALFHLQQRRGFKSNRKVDKADDEKGKIKTAAKKVVEAMAEKGARTFGEYLAGPRVKDPKKAQTTTVRARLHGSGTKAFYDFYPTRAMIEQEFNTLWKKQSAFHGEVLSDEARAKLHDALFFQRPLKPQPVGKCTLDPTERRAPKALPSVQRIRIFQEVNNLTIRHPGEAERKLTLEERDKIAATLLKQASPVKFDSMRTKILKQAYIRFNIESQKRKALDNDKTAAVLANKNRWGPTWRELSLTEQDSIVEYLLEEESEEKLITWLQNEYSLDADHAEAVANAPLPDGHGSLGRTATGKVLPAFEKEVISYDKAVIAAGYTSHSALDFDGEVFDALPYYGMVLERHVAFGSGEPEDHIEKRFGKIANPTVHVALNQIRKVVNALVKRHGPPTEISVEMARDLPLSGKGKKELESTQTANQDANKLRDEELEKYGQHQNYQNRLRMRLWEELNLNNPTNRCCVYTGDQIGIERLFDPEVEIEHILPFSRTLDDSFGNKTLSLRRANRYKRDQTPYEAFSASEGGYDWEAIKHRSSNLPNNKSWRFGPDAMERYENEEQDFLARQLNDTKYIARIAKMYLERTGADVWVTPGRLTSDLRHVWGLNSVLTDHNRQEAADPKKNRNDHRHHAVDAVVIALTDRSLVQQVATAAARTDDGLPKDWLKDFEEPWDDFRDHVRESVGRINVSHKPDHGLEGALHEDTNYGVVRDPETGETRLASRKSLTGLTEAEVGKIGDLRIRSDLLNQIDDLAELRLAAKERKKEITEILETYGKANNIRRVRIHKVQADYEIIRHNGHEKAVIPGENFCVDIVETPDGKWHGVGVTRFEANQQKRLGETTPLWKKQHTNAQHIMRVHKKDLLMLEKDGREQLTVVNSLESAGDRFWLAAAHEAGELDKRYKFGVKLRKEIKARQNGKEPKEIYNKDDISTWTLQQLNDENAISFRWDLASFSKLKGRKARLVCVDEAGRLHDPGPPR